MRRRNFNKEKVRLVTIIAVILAIPLTVFLALKSQDISKLAGPGNAIVTTVPATVQVQPGGTGYSIDLHVDPNGEEVAAAEFYIPYDGTYMTNVNIDPGPMWNEFGGPPQVIRNCVNQDPSPAPSCFGYIHYAVGFPLASGQSTTTPGVAATINFDVSSTASGVFNLNFLEEGDPNTPPFTFVSDPLGNNVVDVAVDGTLSIPQASGATLYFSAPRPANPQDTNSSFDIDVLLDTAGQDVAGVDAIMNFTPSDLQVASIATGDFDAYATPVFSNTTGDIEIHGNVSGGGPALNGNGINVATITFNTGSTAVNPTTVNYDFTLGNLNDSNVAEDGTGNDILASVTDASIVIEPIATVTPSPTATPSASPSPTATATPSVTPSPTATPSASPSPSPTAPPSPNPFAVSIKFLLQGRSRLNASNAKTLELQIQEVGGLTTTQTVTTGTDGTANVNLTAGTYNILADSDTTFAPNPGSYLARLFSNVTITQGQTNLDLTNTPLLGGDFNDDGEVNEVDYTLRMLTNYGDADSVADLDDSGQVNTLDFSLMRANWNLTDDQLL